MGHHTYTMVIYGIELNGDQAVDVCNGEGEDNLEEKMFVKDADGRIQSLTFADYSEHVLGICYADSGYDDIVKNVKKTPAKIIKEFDINIKPLLTKYKIKNKPKIIVINQSY